MSEIDVWRNFLPKFIEFCTERPCWCPSEGNERVSLGFAVKARSNIQDIIDVF